MELWQLQQRQGLPLEAKIIMTQRRIQEWYDYWGGDICISFSGGKDSTVLLHLVREMYPNVEAIFVDTGLEYPEIREFVKSVKNVTWIKPQIDFRTILIDKGYPVISKDVSKIVEYARKGSGWAVEMLDGTRMFHDKLSKYNIKKWKFLLNAPFKISNKCCYFMKKKPLHVYQKETAKKPIIGTMASEGDLRKKGYLKTGCNSFDGGDPISKPMSFWFEDDIWKYLHKFNVPYSKIYDMGYKRTGCMFCMFGCHLEKEPNRFQLMQFTHPKQWEYCMRPVEDGGLGLTEAMDYIGVPWKSKYCQLNLF